MPLKSFPTQAIVQEEKLELHPSSDGSIDDMDHDELDTRAAFFKKKNKKSK